MPVLIEQEAGLPSGQSGRMAEGKIHYPCWYSNYFPYDFISVYPVVIYRNENNVSRNDPHNKIAIIPITALTVKFW